MKWERKLSDGKGRIAIEAFKRERCPDGYQSDEPTAYVDFIGVSSERLTPDDLKTMIKMLEQALRYFEKD